MDKNTIWAIVLSTLVIIAAFILPPMIFPSNNANQNAVTEQSLQSEQNGSETAPTELSEALISESKVSAEEQKDVVEEKTFTVNTGLAEVVLTNKGGDILSYKLSNHYDMDTQTGVQLSDNVSSYNRTCAISLGKATNSIINENFNVEKIDDYTYLFKKSVNCNGKKFILGKKYTFKPNEYVFKLDVLIHSEEDGGLDFGGTAYSLRTSPQIGPHFDPKANRYENRQFIVYNGSKSKKIILNNGQEKYYDKDFVWSGIAGKYFIELIIPTDASILEKAMYSSKIEVNDYANAQSMVERKAFTAKDVQDSYYIYFGPRNENDLKKYNLAESNSWNIGGYRLNESLQTYDWLRWLETILKFAMEKINVMVAAIARNPKGNWGVSIILLTLLLRLVLFPLSKKQSLGTLKMQDLQPKMKVIQEKYKNDQQKMQMEMQKLYKEANYNPASGCLPMLFQFLILFAMFDLFNNYFEFRGAMFIPGWIPDLSKGDSITTLGFTIPLLRTNELRILPIIYLGTQFLFTKITQNNGMNMAGNQSQASMKFMTYGMPLIFFFMFYSAPAGLILYWTVSNIFQIVQQVIINKMMAEKRNQAEEKKPVQKTLPPKNKRKGKI